MNHRTLTEAEDYYVQTLARRILWITAQAKTLLPLELESIHEPTGLPVFVVIGMLMDGAGYTEQEMTEALS